MVAPRTGINPGDSFDPFKNTNCSPYYIIISCESDGLSVIYHWEAGYNIFLNGRRPIQNKISCVDDGLSVIGGQGTVLVICLFFTGRHLSRIMRSCLPYLR